MKWYGLNNNFNINMTKKDKIKFKIKLKKNSIFFTNSINLGKFIVKCYIPHNWNFFLSKSYTNETYRLFIFSSNYFFNLPFFNEFLLLKYDNRIRLFSFNFFFKNNYFPIFWKYFKLIFYSFSKIFFKKLKFKGKGYYIYKNFRNTIALQMGYSHIIRLYSYFINVKFTAKTVIYMFGINKFNIDNRSKNLLILKPINIFTGRGIRFTRQIIYKKTGKISSYR